MKCWRAKKEHALIARNENDGLELLSLQDAALHGNLPFELINSLIIDGRRGHFSRFFMMICLFWQGFHFGGRFGMVDLFHLTVTGIMSSVVSGRFGDFGVFVALGVEAAVRTAASGSRPEAVQKAVADLVAVGRVVAAGRGKALASLQVRMRVWPLGRAPVAVGVRSKLVAPAEQLTGLGQFAIALGQVVLSVWGVLMVDFFSFLMVPGYVVVAFGELVSPGSTASEAGKIFVMVYGSHAVAGLEQFSAIQRCISEMSKNGSRFVGHWFQFILKRTHYRNDPRDQLFRNQNKYFAFRILSRSRHDFVLIYFFLNKYIPILFA